MNVVPNNNSPRLENPLISVNHDLRSQMVYDQNSNIVGSLGALLASCDQVKQILQKYNLVSSKGIITANELLLPSLSAELTAEFNRYLNCPRVFCYDFTNTIKCEITTSLLEILSVLQSAGESILGKKLEESHRFIGSGLIHRLGERYLRSALEFRKVAQEDIETILNSVRGKLQRNPNDDDIRAYFTGADESSFAKIVLELEKFLASKIPPLLADTIRELANTPINQQTWQIPSYVLKQGGLALNLWLVRKVCLRSIIDNRGNRETLYNLLQLNDHDRIEGEKRVKTERPIEIILVSRLRILNGFEEDEMYLPFNLDQGSLPLQPAGGENNGWQWIFNYLCDNRQLAKDVVHDEMAFLRRVLFYCSGSRGLDPSDDKQLVELLEKQKVSLDGIVFKITNKNVENTLAASVVHTLQAAIMIYQQNSNANIVTEFSVLKRQFSTFNPPQDSKNINLMANFWKSCKHPILQMVPFALCPHELPFNQVMAGLSLLALAIYCVNGDDKTSVQFVEHGGGYAFRLGMKVDETTFHLILPYEPKTMLIDVKDLLANSNGLQLLCGLFNRCLGQKILLAPLANTINSGLPLDQLKRLAQEQLLKPKMKAFGASLYQLWSILQNDVPIVDVSIAAAMPCLMSDLKNDNEKRQMLSTFSIGLPEVKEDDQPSFEETWIRRIAGLGEIKLINVAQTLLKNIQSPKPQTIAHLVEALAKTDYAAALDYAHSMYAKSGKCVNAMMPHLCRVMTTLTPAEFARVSQAKFIGLLRQVVSGMNFTASADIKSIIGALLLMDDAVKQDVQTLIEHLAPKSQWKAAFAELPEKSLNSAHPEIADSIRKQFIPTSIQAQSQAEKLLRISIEKKNAKSLAVELKKASPFMTQEALCELLPLIWRLQINDKLDGLAENTLLQYLEIQADEKAKGLLEEFILDIKNPDTINRVLAKSVVKRLFQNSPEQFLTLCQSTLVLDNTKVVSIANITKTALKWVLDNNLYLSDPFSSLLHQIESCAQSLPKSLYVGTMSDSLVELIELSLTNSHTLLATRLLSILILGPNSILTRNTLSSSLNSYIKRLCDLKDANNLRVITPVFLKAYECVPATSRKDYNITITSIVNCFLLLGCPHEALQLLISANKGHKFPAIHLELLATCLQNLLKLNEVHQCSQALLQLSLADIQNPQIRPICLSIAEEWHRTSDWRSLAHWLNHFPKAFFSDPVMSQDTITNLLVNEPEHELILKLITKYPPISASLWHRYLATLPAGFFSKDIWNTFFSRWEQLEGTPTERLDCWLLFPTSLIIDHLKQAAKNLPEEQLVSLYEHTLCQAFDAIVDTEDLSRAQATWRSLEPLVSPNLFVSQLCNIRLALAGALLRCDRHKGGVEMVKQVLGQNISRLDADRITKLIDDIEPFMRSTTNSNYFHTIISACSFIDLQDNFFKIFNAFIANSSLVKYDSFNILLKVQQRNLANQGIEVAVESANNTHNAVQFFLQAIERSSELVDANYLELINYVDSIAHLSDPTSLAPLRDKLWAKQIDSAPDNNIFAAYANLKDFFPFINPRTSRSYLAYIRQLLKATEISYLAKGLYLRYCIPFLENTPQGYVKWSELTDEFDHGDLAYILIFINQIFLRNWQTPSAYQLALQLILPKLEYIQSMQVPPNTTFRSEIIYTTKLAFFSIIPNPSAASQAATVNFSGFDLLYETDKLELEIWHESSFCPVSWQHVSHDRINAMVCFVLSLQKEALYSHLCDCIEAFIEKAPHSNDEKIMPLIKQMIEGLDTLTTVDSKTLLIKLQSLLLKACIKNPKLPWIKLGHEFLECARNKPQNSSIALALVCSFLIEAMSSGVFKDYEHVVMHHIKVLKSYFTENLKKLEGIQINLPFLRTLDAFSSHFPDTLNWSSNFFIECLNSVLVEDTIETILNAYILLGAKFKFVEPLMTLQNYKRFEEKLIDLAPTTIVNCLAEATLEGSKNIGEINCAVVSLNRIINLLQFFKEYYLLQSLGVKQVSNWLFQWMACVKKLSSYLTADNQNIALFSNLAWTFVSNWGDGELQDKVLVRLTKLLIAEDWLDILKKFPDHFNTPRLVSTWQEIVSRAD